MRFNLLTAVFRAEFLILKSHRDFFSKYEADSKSYICELPLQMYSDVDVDDAHCDNAECNKNSCKCQDEIQTTSI